MNSTLLSSLVCTVALVSGCTTPLSEQLAGRKLPVANSVAVGGEAADVSFSADPKYESKAGVPLKGDPLICANGTVSRINDGASSPDHIAVEAGKEVTVTSVIAWVNTGFRRVCGPFVTFTAEPGAKYVVVNERVGGKGVSILWTGMGRQTCEVSVYQVTPGGFTPVRARKADPKSCRTPED